MKVNVKDHDRGTPSGGTTHIGKYKRGFASFLWRYFSPFSKMNRGLYGFQALLAGFIGFFAFFAFMHNGPLSGLMSFLGVHGRWSTFGGMVEHILMGSWLGFPGWAWIIGDILFTGVFNMVDDALFVVARNPIKSSIAGAGLLYVFAKFVVPFL